MKKLTFPLILLFLILAGCTEAPPPPSAGAEETQTVTTPEPPAEPEPAPAPAPAPPVPLSGYDLVIQGARVMDPETGRDEVASIGIKGDTIAAIYPAELQGSEVIDARGWTAAPGFIDTGTPFNPKPGTYHYVEHWKLTEGVTTVLWLHDGWAPVRERIDPIRDKVHLTNWGVGLSLTSLYSHGLNHEGRLAMLEKCLQDGGLSASTSPEYHPYITTEQLIDYARLIKEAGLWMGLHLRYSHKQNELEGVREAVRIAEETGVKLHIYHINSTGATYHADEALEILEAARARGLEITADVYPYSFWMTFLNSSRFAPGFREGFGLDYKDLYYVRLRRYLTEELYHQLRGEAGLTVVPEGTISWEESILPLLSKDWVHIGSDGLFDVSPDYGQPFASHPRNTGTFTDGLAIHRREDLPPGKLDLMSLIRKVSLDPANLAAYADPEFRKRGRLQVGCYADITLFDPETVEGKGTIYDTGQPSAGIHGVIVNGRKAYWEGDVTGADAGRLMNRGK